MTEVWIRFFRSSSPAFLLLHHEDPFSYGSEKWNLDIEQRYWRTICELTNFINWICLICYNYYFPPCKFFSPALGGCPSLESDWQQVYRTILADLITTLWSVWYRVFLWFPVLSIASLERIPRVSPTTAITVFFIGYLILWLDRNIC